MLTGDKLETAKSISISSGLFNPNLDKIYIIQNVKTSLEMNTKLKNILAQVKDSVVSSLKLQKSPFPTAYFDYF